VTRAAGRVCGKTHSRLTPLICRARSGAMPRQPVQLAARLTRLASRPAAAPSLAASGSTRLAQRARPSPPAPARPSGAPANFGERPHLFRDVARVCAAAGNARSAARSSVTACFTSPVMVSPSAACAALSDKLSPTPQASKRRRRCAIGGRGAKRACMAPTSGNDRSWPRHDFGTPCLGGRAPHALCGNARILSRSSACPTIACVLPHPCREHERSRSGCS